ncbi:MAG: FAD-dependent oxidoreductase [Solirubrobacteraceae bacterium]|jgi:predicted NAD/FAD-binding protein
MRIAVIGAGVSGLVSAHLLAPQHDVVLYEAGAYAGGHTNTVRVDTADETHQIDTGFIVFNDRNYPQFERLLERLRVPSQPSHMSFSVADEHGAFEYNGASPNGVFATRELLRKPWFHRMLFEIPRFQRAARKLIESEETGPSLGSWLEQERFSQAFIERLIVPQASAVWSADPSQMWSFPARFLAEFFDNHGMLGLRGRPRWRVVRGGSARYVEALTRPFASRIRLSAPVAEIRRSDSHVELEVRGGDSERFDHVVIATHSDQALGMLADATAHEHEILGAIPYQANQAVLHTDVRMLPRRRRAWASWNYHLLDEPQPRAAVTYHMNRLQTLSSSREFLVTLNRSESIDPAQVIRTIDYSHPVFTRAGVKAQQRVAEISGQNRTHYCGAYWGWGFHEDGVRSALRVAEGLGVRP